MKEIVEKILADLRYQKNIEYGQPRSGHPEGKVRFHIANLEANLERLVPRGISTANYWKLKFLIHVHDTFKAESEHDVPILHPHSHATLARQYASKFTNDLDLLNMIQFHDQNYVLWKEFSQTGFFDAQSFQVLLDTIRGWDLFLIFIIIDGCTKGKEYAKLEWFIDEVRKHKKTIIDKTWLLPFEEI
jgi:hypothetical protein